ncbi:hypothetical protein [Fimbriimonas ginsengisoli]|nr:hypothetical protein [Fimbriimonas ginsengisoli]
MKRLLILLGLLISTAAFSQQFGAQPSPAEMAKATAELKKFERDYKTAKAAYTKAPKNPKARDKFEEAATKYGHASMESPALPAKVKYRQALRIYREVLKINPNNPVAKKESDMMIAIYKQMGRPIPK